VYTIGKTGMGKSTLLENMIVKDIEAGEGVALVDPHGDLAEKVMRYIPSSRTNDVIYFNPADTEYPIAFNVVEQVDPEVRHLVASGLIEVFRKLWADSWGPRLEYILRNTILAILDYPSATLLAVTRMLSDKEFRKKIVEKVQDPVVKSFWTNEFASYADKFATEAVSPIQNKVGQFLSSSLIRNIVGQVRSSIDVRKVMDDRKILILNLSKGRIGEDNSALLGAMMITKMQLAAMSRVNIPESERKDFYLYIDEFQEFSTESFASILAEARKYRLNLIMSHQYIEQLHETVKAAIFGNIGTLISFRVGAADAEELVREFTPIFTEGDLVNIPKYEMYLKLMIDGIASDPFSAIGLPPLTAEQETGNMEKAIRVSRERYATSKSVVEDKILRFHSNINTKTGSKSAPRGGKQEANNNANRVTGKSKGATGTGERDSNTGSQATKNKTTSSDNLVNCYRCGQETSAPFKPDGIRPVYCKECLQQIREERKNEGEQRKEKKKQELEMLKKDMNYLGEEKTVSDKGEHNLKAEGKSPDKTNELSLGQAMKMEPVHFGHKKTQTSQSKGKSPSSFKEKNRHNRKQGPKVDSGSQDDGVMNEGEDIYIS
jgi:CxxC-x17-CxxC domain-containing protein